jgi:hypothetical protein
MKRGDVGLSFMAKEQENLALQANICGERNRMHQQRTRDVLSVWLTTFA